MKIRLTTIRDIPDEMIDTWIEAVKSGLSWIDEDYLRKNGKQTYVSTDEIVPGIFSKAETTVEVIK